MHTSRPRLFKPPLGEIMSKWGEAHQRQGYQDCVGHWGMVGGGGTTIYDLSGYGNVGVLTNMDPATAWTIGQWGPALAFDGTNDQVIVGSALGLGAANVTLAAWVYLSGTSLKGLFMKAGTGTNGFGFGVGSTTIDNLGNNIIGLYENIRWIATGQALGTGWHHVAMLIDSAGVPSFMIDGLPVSGTFTGTNAFTPTATVYLGGYDADGETPRFFAGMLDDARAYRRALSVAEIAALVTDPWAPWQARPRVWAVETEESASDFFPAWGAMPAYLPVERRVWAGIEL